jgi:hypothetical protein
MSPWGSTGPKLGLYVERPDLDRHLAELDREAQRAGLEPVLRRSLEDRGGERYELRVLEGEDRLGRTTLAIRVATRHGVVLADGPPDERSLEPTAELVMSLPDGEGGVTPVLADLTGDGTIDLLTRTTAGIVRITSLNPRGSTTTRLPYPNVVRARREETGVVLEASVGCVVTDETARVEQTPCAGRGSDLLRRLYPRDGAFSLDRERELAWHHARAASLEGNIHAAAGTLRERLCIEREFHLRVAEAPAPDLSTSCTGPSFVEARRVLGALLRSADH